MFLTTLKQFKASGQGELHSWILNKLTYVHKDGEYTEKSKGRQTNPVHILRKIKNV